MNFNYDRFIDLIVYFEEDDVNYSELQEIRDKLNDFKEMVEDKMEQYYIE